VFESMDRALTLEGQKLVSFYWTNFRARCFFYSGFC
jgi:hypothetical protein